MGAVAAHAAPAHAPAKSQPAPAPGVARLPPSPGAGVARPDISACACGGGCPRCAEHATLQAKLEVSTPGDPFEQEADRVAEQVMRMPDSHTGAGAVLSSRLATPAVGRKCAACSDREQHAADGASPAHVLPGAGRPLADSERAFFEPRFGRDFGQVRIHADGRAAELARSLNARAYTVGRDIVFGAGQYAPGTAGGRLLIAHELAHVVQQRPTPLAFHHSLTSPAAGDLSLALPQIAGANGYVKPQISAPAQPIVQRQTAPPAFAGCSSSDRRAITRAIGRARQFISDAMAALPADPAPNSPYAEALAIHFLNPTAAQRRRIRRVYERIMMGGALGGRNFTCTPVPLCQTGAQAVWVPSDDLIHICRRFFGRVDHENCRAITLIHELAHDFGIDLAGRHVANRGTAHYPVAGAGPPTRPMTATGRIIDPDPYGFFAAHVSTGNDTPGDCF